MILRGVFSVPCVFLLDPVRVVLAGPPDLPWLPARNAGISLAVARWLVCVLIAPPVLAYLGRDKTFMQPAPLQGGLAIRVAVTASWYPTGAIGHLAHIRKRLSRLGWGRTHVV